MAEIVLTGRQILDRWGMLPFELVEIILARGITAVDPLSGEKHDRENDNCFFCKKDMKHYSPCHDRKAYLAWNNVEGTCINKMRAEYRNRRLGELKFLVRDVEGYEQEHGLASLVPIFECEEDTGLQAQQKEDVLCSSNRPWISGKEVMERLGLTPVELAVASFFLEIDVNYPRRETILNHFTQFVTAEWYRENQKILKIYAEDYNSYDDDFIEEIIEKTCRGLSPKEREEAFDFWVDGASSFLFSREGIENLEKVYSNAGLCEPFLTQQSLAQLISHGSVVPRVSSGNTGIDQQPEISLRLNFKTPKEHRDHLFARDPHHGRIMIELHKKWGMKKLEAAAIALGDAVPEDKEERARYGEKWRYHTSKLEQDE